MTGRPRRAALLTTTALLGARVHLTFAGRRGDLVRLESHGHVGTEARLKSLRGRAASDVRFRPRNPDVAAVGQWSVRPDPVTTSGGFEGFEVSSIPETAKLSRWIANYRESR